MKPHVVMHMMSTLDGRILADRWPGGADFNTVYEEVHRALAGDAWLVGSTTMAEFAQGEPRPVETSETFPRTTWKAPGAAKGPYAVAIDRRGQLQLNRDSVNGDPLILVLTEKASDAHLAELRRDGISYVFAGTHELDLARALALLAEDFGIRRLLLEGGGNINGAFLSAGLIDEISNLIVPLADGGQGVPTIFERSSGDTATLALTGVDRLAHGIIHLRYTIER